MQTIIARFDEVSRAQEAIAALIQRKYDPADISFLANDISGTTILSEARTPRTTGEAALGLLIGLGVVAIPYVGPLLAAGPLAVGLAGVTADAAHDHDEWISGVLGDVGVPGPDARAYGKAVRRGGALVLMGAREAVADNIIAVLWSSGAATVDLYLRDAASSGA